MVKHTKRQVNDFKLCVCFKCLSPECSFCFNIEFVGSLLCSEGFFYGYSGFPLSQKTTFDLICRDLV